MKKIEFYTRLMKNGVAVAEKVTGYTDGSYNYYKQAYGTWCAVHPFSGLAIPTSYGETRKNAVAMAHAYTEVIARNITVVNHQALLFQEMIKEVEKNEKNID